MKSSTPLVLALGFWSLALPVLRPAQAGSLKPVNLVKLNTENDEEDPFQSADGKTLFYVSNDGGRFDIMVSSRTKLTQPWPAGKPLKALNQDASADRRSPFLTKDGKFYFASDALPKDPEQKSTKNFDLYYSIKLSPRLSFTQPTAVLGLCTEADELHPWVTPSGKEIYFSRKTKEGWRVFVAKGPALGAITDPKPVELPVDFHHPSLSSDGLTMYLQGPVDKDRWGLYRTTRTRLTASWSKPVELPALNHSEAPRGDMSPSLSADGATLYFVSDRPGGKGGLDLWMIPVAKLKKAEMSTE
jgi:Tol biopolymer transport system component